MSDRFQTEPPDRPEPPEPSGPDISHNHAPFPSWLARRLLEADEEVTWVRGPRWNPSAERVLTHPLLFLLALALGVGILLLGRLLVDSWAHLSPIAGLGALASVFGSIYLLGIANTYFTRLVVTNYRLLVVQGYEICRTWDIDDLPPSLLHYGARGSRGKPTIDLGALQTMLGTSSDQFVESKTVMAFAKKLDGIKAEEKKR